MDVCRTEETESPHRRRSYSPGTSDSETDGDDLADDEDIDFRKNINPILNLGQTITALWPISLIEHAEDVEQDFADSSILSKSDSSGLVSRDSFFATKHRRAPSLPSQLQLDEIKLKLDEIQLNTDDEYGFNPKRNGSRRSSSGRPVSLYSSNDMIGLGISKQFDEFFLSVNNLEYSKSLARNAIEAKIEDEITQLRSQPSRVVFSRKNEAKENFKELLSHRNTSKAKHRSMYLRRKLSFDSHPRRRAFSDTESVNKKSRRHYVYADDSKDLKVKSDLNLSELKPKHLLEDLNRCESDPAVSQSFAEIKLAPLPQFEGKQILEVLVSNEANLEKEKRRRTTIPQFLNALKLPNKKTIKKFMRRKNDRRQKPIVPVIPAPFPSENGSDEFVVDKPEQCHAELSASTSVNTFDKSNKIDRSAERRRSRRLLNSGKKMSCSTCSLPRVQEGEIFNP